MSKIEEIDVSKYFDGTKQIAKIKKLSFGELVDIKDSTPMAIDKITQVPKELEGQAAILFMRASLLSVPIIKKSGDVEQIVQVSNPTIEEIRSIDFDLGTFLIEKIYAKNNLAPN